MNKKLLIFFLTIFYFVSLNTSAPISLCYCGFDNLKNFGDHLSLELVKKILGKNDIPVIPFNTLPGKKLLTIGSILHLANDGDIVWGSGINGRYFEKHQFKNLDVRAVRGPLTRQFLLKKEIKVPEIYGDPALLMPLFFPEFKNQKKKYEYTLIPHFYDLHLFKNEKNVISPFENWRKIIQRIVESKLVISSALHGIIVAEAYGIPARLLLPKNEPLFKYYDYYLGTGRNQWKYANTIEEALKIGGEKPPKCNLITLLKSFPFKAFK